MGNSKSSFAEEAQPSSTSTNEPGPGVFQDAGGEAEGEAEGEENSRRPEKFWNNDFLPLYKLLPYPITPPEGWAKYKSEKKKGRPFGNNHPSPDLWGGNEKKRSNTPHHSWCTGTNRTSSPLDQALSEFPRKKPLL